jgi:hypothetical protein
LGALAVNSLQFGVGITVRAPPFSDFYLVQLTLAGGWRLTQGRTCIDAPAGSIAIINPGRSFALTVFPDTRRLMLRVDRQLVEREWRAWTGSDSALWRVAFRDPSPRRLAPRTGLPYWARLPGFHGVRGRAPPS